MKACIRVVLRSNPSKWNTVAFNSKSHARRAYNVAVAAYKDGMVTIRGSDIYFSAKSEDIESIILFNEYTEKEKPHA